MGSLATRVRQVLEKKAKVPVKKGVVLLKEERVMEVKVVAVPDDVTVINVEKMGSLSGVRGRFQSRCDYLVLFQKSGTDTAVFVELKRTLKDECRGLEQLRRSPPYLEYLRTLCSIQFEDRYEPSRRVSVRYVLVGKHVTSLLAKSPVSNPQVLSEESHKGITVRRLVGERIHFDRLEGTAP